MARGRGNGGVIGNKTQTNTRTAGGVRLLGDSTLTHSEGAPLASRRNLMEEVSPDNGNFDPYYDKVPVHFGDALYDDDIMRDRSQYGWDKYYSQDAYARVPQLAQFGPRYQDWCTHFHESNYYTVTSYSQLVLATSNFTIEFWVQLCRNDATEHHIMGKGGNAGRTAGTGWSVYVSTDRKIGFFDAVGNSSTQSATALVLDTWYHVAIVRSGTGSNLLKIYRDGVLDATGTSSGNFADTSNFYIGCDRVATGSTWFGGNLSDLKISNSAQYATAFAKPTAPLTSTGAVFFHSMQTPHHDDIPTNTVLGYTVTQSDRSSLRLLDGPLINHALRPYQHGSNSVYSWDTQAYLKCYDASPTSTALRLGTGAFTIEAWVHTTNADGNRQTGILGKGTGNTGAGGTGWSLYTNTSGYLEFADTGSTLTASTNRIGWCGWYHVAAVREGTGTNQFKMYVNGILSYTGTVATDFNQTTHMTVFGSRNSQYILRGYICGLRLSNTARYTATFNPMTSAFMDTAMTSDNNTLFLTGTSGTKHPITNSTQWKDYGSLRMIVYRMGNEVRYGEHNITTARHGSSVTINNGGSQHKVLVTTTNSSFDFGTGDFSIEFWFMERYGFDAQNTSHTLFDTRVFWNDAGISLRINGWRQLDLVTGNQVIMTDPSTMILAQIWYHICVQRANGNMAIYINGTKAVETRYTGTISAPANKLFIMNGSYPNLSYSSAPTGRFCDFRVVKGTGAYTIGTGADTGNPTRIPVPTRQLTAITNTVLLTGSGPLVKDYSAALNKVEIGGRNEVNFTSSWDMYWASNQTPYKGVDFDITTCMFGDSNDSNGYYARQAGYASGNTQSGLAFITHMATPWTIELWIYGQQMSPPTGGGQSDVLFTANGTTLEGWRFYTNYNGTANSWADLTFFMYTAHNNGSTYISTTGGLGANGFVPHSWNHVAVVFDPTKGSAVAMFINGGRAATRAAFTAGQKIWNSYDLQRGFGVGGVRISKTARYDNDSLTYTVPTGVYTVDANTAFQSNLDGPFINIPNHAVTHIYGATPNYAVKKFGKASMHFSNKEGGNLIDRMNLGGSSWNTRPMDIYYNDMTIELWANWWDAAAGGKAPTATYGNCLMHYAGSLMIGINSAGQWIFRRQGGGGTSPTIYWAITSPVYAATVTNNAWDFVAFVRRGGNYYFYINGVEYPGTNYGSNFGTYASNGPTTNINDAPTGNSLHLGCDTNVAGETSWSGNVQDFRVTHIARYETVVINNVPTMCHRGTRTPALPTALFPTK